MTAYEITWETPDEQHRNKVNSNRKKAIANKEWCKGNVFAHWKVYLVIFRTYNANIKYVDPSNVPLFWHIYNLNCGSRQYWRRATSWWHEHIFWQKCISRSYFIWRQNQVVGIVWYSWQQYSNILESSFEGLICHQSGGIFVFLLNPWNNHFLSFKIWLKTAIWGVRCTSLFHNRALMVLTQPWSKAKYPDYWCS